MSKPGGNKTIKRALIATVLIVVATPLMCCVASSVPLGFAKPDGRQLTVVNADGHPVTISLWKKGKLITLPFTEDAYYYVKCGNSFEQLTTGGWVSLPGHLRISPDLTTVYVHCTSEHGSWPELKIDLRTQKIVRVSDVRKSINLDGWDGKAWHTSLELLSEDQLRAMLKGITDASRLARDEYEVRASNNKNWLPYLTLLLDDRIDSDARRLLVIGLSLRSRSAKLTPEALAIAGTLLEHPTPELQLAAAAILADFAGSPPAKHVIASNDTDPEFAADHAKYVPMFRAWWSEGAAATQPTTQPR